MTLADLRSKAPRVSIYTHCVRDGVLRDVGLAAQEMPEGTGGGSLTGYLHRLDEAKHNEWLAPGLRSEHATIMTSQRIAEVRDALTTGAGLMPIEDVATVYGRGTSLTLQDVGFAPYMVSGDDVVPVLHDYTDAINAIIAEWPGRPIFVNVGAANNTQFPTGELWFNRRYSLRTRTDQNIFRPYVDAIAFAVEPTQWVAVVGTLCADMQARQWPKCIYDPSHPEVVTLIKQSITDMVDEFGTQLRYICHGEAGMALGQEVEECDVVERDTCLGCEPKANSASHNVQGFRVWLQEYLGLNISELNARWSTGYTDFAQIDPSAQSFCPSAPMAIRDWNDFQRWVIGELATQEYEAAKGANPQVMASRSSFGHVGIERSALRSDAATAFDWHGETYEQYLAQRRMMFVSVSAAVRLLGVPPLFPVTAPAYVPAVDYSGQEALPELLRAHRTYTPQAVAHLFRDCLASSCVGIGYLRSAAASFGGHAGSVTAVLEQIDDLVAIHPTHFAFTATLPRVAIHRDPDDPGAWTNSAEGNGASRIAYWVHAGLRRQHASCALFQDARVLDRAHARTMLDQSVVVVPNHSRLDEILDTYRARYPDGHTGAVVVVEENITATVPSWVEDTVVLSTGMGTLYRGLDDSDDPINVWYYATRPQGPCKSLDGHWKKIADSLVEHVIPHVGESCAQVGSLDWMSTAIEVDTAGDVETNHVTDGINFTVAITNMATEGAASITLSVRDDIATALGVTYDPLSFSLDHGETQFVALDADIGVLDIEAAILDAQTKAEALAGYLTADVIEILDHAAAIADTHPGRAAGGYLAAVRAPILQVNYADPTLSVTAVRLGIVGEATSIPIQGARAQLIWPLNAHEEGAEGLTDASGEIDLTVGAPTIERWDFATSTFVAPAPEAAAVVEVHVTDPASGASSRALVTLS